MHRRNFLKLSVAATAAGASFLVLGMGGCGVDEDLELIVKQGVKLIEGDKNKTRVTLIDKIPLADDHETHLKKFISPEGGAQAHPAFASLTPDGDTVVYTNFEERLRGTAKGYTLHVADLENGRRLFVPPTWFGDPSGFYPSGHGDFRYINTVKYVSCSKSIDYILPTFVFEQFARKLHLVEERAAGTTICNDLLVQNSGGSISFRELSDIGWTTVLPKERSYIENLFGFPSISKDGSVMAAYARIRQWAHPAVKDAPGMEPKDGVALFVINDKSMISRSSVITGSDISETTRNFGDTFYGDEFTRFVGSDPHVSPDRNYVVFAERGYTEGGKQQHTLVVGDLREYKWGYSFGFNPTLYFDDPIIAISNISDNNICVVATTKEVYLIGLEHTQQALLLSQYSRLIDNPHRYSTYGGEYMGGMKLADAPTISRDGTKVLLPMLEEVIMSEQKNLHLKLIQLSTAHMKRLLKEDSSISIHSIG